MIDRSRKGPNFIFIFFVIKILFFCSKNTFHFCYKNISRHYGERERDFWKRFRQKWIPSPILRGFRNAQNN
jgi:hypothetical protein